jgi:hypothetical protein
LEAATVGIRNWEEEISAVSSRVASTHSVGGVDSWEWRAYLLS